MTDELIGKIIDGYEITDRIGAGGMATVYRARQQSMGRDVALKILPQQFLNDDTYLQRFKREVQIVSQLEHRNIVPVHDYGKYEAQPYIVMRYMPAGSVDDLLRKGPISSDKMLRIMQQIAPALDYAHSRDVLHRDLKPSNVLMDNADGAFLTDFGIARIVGEQGVNITTQGVVGTPSYMSPEQAQGKALDNRSDIYALGVMLFEMATGRRPFESTTPYSIAVMQVTTPPPAPRTLNPNISSALEKVILISLKKNRDERYPTAAALYEALKLAIEHPHIVHDTEPHARGAFSGSLLQAAKQPEPPTASAVAQQPPLYQPTPSSNNRAVVPPSRHLRAAIRRRRKQNPLLSTLIGGSIGCGLLIVIAVAGFLALNFLLPGDTAPAATGVPTANSQASLVPPQSVVLDGRNEDTSPTLDPTSETARQTLIARNINNDATATAAAESTALAPAPTAGIDPVGVRGTPELRSVLRPVRGKIVFADTRGDNQTLEIVTLDLDTFVETQLTDEPDAQNSYPLPSPDGRWIAYQSNRDGDFEIYIMNPLGGQRQQLTDNNHFDRLAAWSPDGEWIIYSADVRGDETFDLRRVRVDGSADELVLSTGERLSHARYSPDGQYLIFTIGPNPLDARTWEIARFDLATGDLVRLTENNVRDASAVFGPDGETILYVTFDGRDNALATMGSDGSSPRILYDSSGSDWSANYSPDGDFIVFTSNVSGADQLYLMTADGQNVQQITSSGGLYASWIPQRE